MPPEPALPHGGDVVGYELAHRRPPLDFSASLSPLGMPAAVREAAVRAIDEAAPYPDPLCRRLTAALAARLGLPPETILCGNGAADLIFLLVRAAKPARALLPIPSFLEYEEALASIGCEILYHRLEERKGFRLDESILVALRPGIDILFLCQPNNPTAQPIEPDLLAAILRRAEKYGTLLVLDECFCRFLPDWRRHSLTDRVAAHPRLVVVDSFTKLYGMAGLRLGYAACGDAGLVAAMRRMGQPWAVSNVAQAAGLAALGEESYVEETLRAVEAGRAWLREELPRVGLEVIGSGANYLFLRAGIPDLPARLAREGILIRDCANFRGLGPGYCRVAVRLPEENRRLVEAIRRVRAQGNGE